MILDVFAIALLLSLLLKKRVYHLDKLRFKLIYLFPVPFVLQILPWFDQPLLMVISYSILFLIFVVNRSIKGFRYIAVGSLMNAFVIILNQGRMPVYEPFARWLELKSSFRHIFFPEFNTRLILGDWIPAILPWGRKFLISPGDILIYIGTFVFFLTISDDN